MRSEDLVAAIQPPGPPAGNVTFRQGVIKTWNTLTAENTVEMGGSVLANLPIIASSGEVLAMKPGDVVGIQVVSSGGFSTMYIIGRITKPGTPQAASFMELFGMKVASEATAGDALTLWSVSDLGDLQSPANPGPAVTVTVGRTGRVLVLVEAEIVSSRGDVGFSGGQVGIKVSGANTIAANDQIGLAWTKYHVTADAGAVESWLMSGNHTYTDLAPGETTFKLRYGRASSTTDTAVKNRSIMALPL